MIFIRLSTIATVFALLAVPTLARAHGGNNDPNAVHACINNASKSVRIVGVTGSCTGAETPAHWDIDGTKGKNGVDGTSVAFVDYFAGNQNGCPNGGAIYAAGNPPANAYGTSYVIPIYAWHAMMNSGFVLASATKDAANIIGVWPVRGGSR